MKLDEEHLAALAVARDTGRPERYERPFRPVHPYDCEPTVLHRNVDLFEGSSMLVEFTPKTFMLPLGLCLVGVGNRTTVLGFKHGGIERLLRAGGGDPLPAALFEGRPWTDNAFRFDFPVLTHQIPGLLHVTGPLDGALLWGATLRP